MRKNLWKKAWKIGAGVITMFLMCSTLAAAFSNLNELIVDPKGPYIGTIREPVQFSCLINGGVPPFNITWDFGDGYFSNESNPSHQYDERGTFNVTLTVTDNDNTSVTVNTMAIIGDWQLIVDIWPADGRGSLFGQGWIEFLALIINSEGSIDPTPPIEYEIWVEKLVFQNSNWMWIFYGHLRSGEIDPLCSGCSKEIDGLDWYANKNGVFKVCIKVTAGCVAKRDCYQFRVSRLRDSGGIMEFNIHNAKIRKIFSEIDMFIDILHSKLLSISKLFFH